MRGGERAVGAKIDRRPDDESTGWDSFIFVQAHDPELFGLLKESGVAEDLVSEFMGAARDLDRVALEVPPQIKRLPDHRALDLLFASWDVAATAVMWWMGAQHEQLLEEAPDGPDCQEVRLYRALENRRGEFDWHEVLFARLYRARQRLPPALQHGFEQNLAVNRNVGTPTPDDELLDGWFVWLAHDIVLRYLDRIRHCRKTAAEWLEERLPPLVGDGGIEEVCERVRDVRELADDLEELWEQAALLHETFGLLADTIAPIDGLPPDDIDAEYREVLVSGEAPDLEFLVERADGLAEAVRESLREWVLPPHRREPTEPVAGSEFVVIDEPGGEGDEPDVPADEATAEPADADEATGDPADADEPADANREDEPSEVARTDDEAADETDAVEPVDERGDETDNEQPPSESAPDADPTDAPDSDPDAEPATPEPDADPDAEPTDAPDDDPPPLEEVEAAHDGGRRVEAPPAEQVPADAPEHATSPSRRRPARTLPLRALDDRLDDLLDADALDDPPRACEILAERQRRLLREGRRLAAWSLADHVDRALPVDPGDHETPDPLIPAWICRVALQIDDPRGHLLAPRTERLVHRLYDLRAAPLYVQRYLFAWLAAGRLGDDEAVARRVADELPEPLLEQDWLAQDPFFGFLRRHLLDPNAPAIAIQLQRNAAADDATPTLRPDDLADARESGAQTRSRLDDDGEPSARPVGRVVERLDALTTKDDRCHSPNETPSRP